MPSHDDSRSTMPTVEDETMESVAQQEGIGPDESESTALPVPQDEEGEGGSNIDENGVQVDETGKECLDAQEPGEPRIAPVAATRRSGKKTLAERGPLAMPKSRGTGFEMFYADPPMTVAEATEEREEFYAPTRSFAQRIETCIQRFRSRRRVPSELVAYFDYYLFLGGVDCTQRHFNTATARDAEEREMSKDDFRVQTSNDMVHDGRKSPKFYSDYNPEGWVVDFTGVVAGFLSDAASRMTNGNPVEQDNAISVVENFLRYVLHHDVCTEYAKDVRTAISLCDKARTDLPMADQAMARFPGEFTLAALELFCAGDAPVPDDANEKSKSPENFNPEVVFTTAMMLLGPLEYALELGSKGIDKALAVASCTRRTLEIVSVDRPSAKHRQVFSSVAARGPKSHGVSPVGTILTKPCWIDDGWDDGAIARSQPLPQTEERFLLDDSVLCFLQAGNKLEVDVCKLSTGFSFIKSLLRVAVPWYTFLPQELMNHFREGGVDLRPARTAGGSEIAENGEEEDMMPETGTSPQEAP